MRDLAELPRVSCKLESSDGLVDIESFRAGATSTGWTNDEITVAVAKALGQCRVLDDVGVVLCQYCIPKSWVSST